MYSAFCGEMASRGYVVLAVEHRDGTSPSSKISTSDGVTREIDFLNYKDIDWPDMDVQPANDTTLRHEQIRMRCAEMEEARKIVDKIARGIPVERYSFDAPPEFGWDRWKHIDASRPVLAGHSLGGAAAVSMFYFRTETDPTHFLETLARSGSCLHLPREQCNSSGPRDST